MTRTLLADKTLLTKSVQPVPSRMSGVAAFGAALCALACNAANAAGPSPSPTPAPARQGSAMESVLVFKNSEPPPAVMDVAPPGGIPSPSRDRFGQPLRSPAPAQASAPGSSAASSPEQQSGLPPLPVAASGAGAATPEPSSLAASGGLVAGKPVAVFGTMQAAAQAGVDPLQRKAQVVSPAEPSVEPVADSWRPAWLLELGATLRSLERMSLAQLVDFVRARPPVAAGLAGALGLFALIVVRSMWRRHKSRR